MFDSSGLPSLKEYLSGALVGSAPLIVMAIIFSFTEIKLTETEIATITFILVVIGAIVGGFLVAGKANVGNYRRNMLVGGITGLFSFLFTVIYFILMLRIYTGGVKLLAGFLLGGCIGGVLSYRTRC